MNYEDKLRHLLSKLPHKRQVSFALDCALDVRHLMQDPRSLKALEVTALWLEDKATKEEIKVALKDADAAHDESEIVVAYVALATIAAANAINAIYGAKTAYHASYALNLPIEHYYTKLLNSLTEVEKVIYEI